jgi:hypothetical protein
VEVDGFFDDTEDGSAAGLAFCLLVRALCSSADVARVLLGTPWFVRHRIHGTFVRAPLAPLSRCRQSRVEREQHPVVSAREPIRGLLHVARDGAGRLGGVAPENGVTEDCYRVVIAPARKMSGGCKPDLDGAVRVRAGRDVDRDRPQVRFGLPGSASGDPFSATRPGRAAADKAGGAKCKVVMSRLTGDHDPTVALTYSGTE